MAKNTEDMIRLGIFVTLGIALFFFGVYYIGNSKNMFGRTITLYADFQNVSGLQPGNNVRFMGINIGSIDDIAILNDTTLRVAMTIKKTVQNNLKKDAIASIGTNGLVGGSLVNIIPGPGKLPLVEDNDILKSKRLLSTGDMLNTLDKTNANLVLLSENLLEITEKIKQGDGLAGMLINDEGLAEEINSSVKNIRKTGDNLVVMSHKLNRMIADVGDGEGLLGYLLTDTTLMPQMEDLAVRMELVVENQIEPILTDLKKTTEEVNLFSQELNTIVADVNKGNGALGVLLKDQTTEQHIQEIIANINESTAKLTENMEALRHNWFFRRYFKKKEKEAKKKAKMEDSPKTKAMTN